MASRSYRSWLAALLGITLSLTLLAPASARDPEPRITLSDLSSAQVPSLCGHPAGQLVDGYLPGLSEGEVWFTGDAAFGTIQPGAAPGAVAVMACHAGGAPWPAQLVMYAADGSIIGHRSLMDFTGSGRESAEKVTIVKGAIRVQIGAVKIDRTDCEACAAGSALVHLRWSAEKQGFRVVRKRVFRERPAAVKAVRAVQQGRRTVALRHASPPVVRQLFWVKRQRGRMTVGKCFGRLHVGFPELDPDRGWPRMCHVYVSWPGGYASTFGLLLSPRTWKTWKGRKLLGLAG